MLSLNPSSEEVSN